MSATRTMGIDVTDVDTSAKLPLGFVYREPASGDAQGEKHWVYVFNDEASTAFAVGHIIYRDPSETSFDYYGGLITPISVHQPKVMVLGVAQHAIAAGSYGFILKRGVGYVKSGSVAVAADSPFTTGGDDVGCALVYADDASALGSNIGVIGHTATILVADAATVYALISCGL